MATGNWRCPDCGIDGDVTLANELCVFLQMEQPVLKGSGLIVPCAHRETPFDLTEAEWATSRALLQAVRGLLDTRLQPAGYNVGWNVGAVAGQELAHVHLHVIPRFPDEPLAGKGIRNCLKQPGNARPR